MAYTAQDIDNIRETIPEEYRAGPENAGLTSAEFTNLSGTGEIANGEPAVNEENAYGDRTRMRADASQATTAIQLSVSIAGTTYTMAEMDEITADILDNWEDMKSRLENQGFNDREIAQAKEYISGFKNADTRAEEQYYLDKIKDSSAASKAVDRKGNAIEQELQVDPAFEQEGPSGQPLLGKLKNYKNADTIEEKQDYAKKIEDSPAASKALDEEGNSHQSFEGDLAQDVSSKLTDTPSGQIRSYGSQIDDKPDAAQKNAPELNGAFTAAAEGKTNETSTQPNNNQGPDPTQEFALG